MQQHTLHADMNINSKVMNELCRITSGDERDVRSQGVRPQRDEKFFDEQRRTSCPQDFDRLQIELFDL